MKCAANPNISHESCVFGQVARFASWLAIRPIATSTHFARDAEPIRRNGSMMFATLAVVALMHASAAQVPGLAGYDVRDLDTIAARRQLDFRGILARAESRSVEALRVVLLFAEPAEIVGRARGRQFPSWQQCP